jgi:flagellar assembly factor FliW
MNNAERVPQAGNAPLHVVTRFGAFDVDQRDIVEFPDGMPGFERCHEFVVLSSQAMGPLQCLHAVDGPDATFLAIDPRIALQSFRCVLSPGDRLRLGASEDTPLLWLALITLDEHASATANLRAPVVINPERMCGYQLVPLNSLYPLRYPLAPE